MTRGRFDGRVALVTGAASGIGRAVAAALAQEGAQVMAADCSAAALNEAVAAIVATGGHALAVETDVASSASVARLFDTIGARFGRLDVAANCAGVTGPTDLLADVEEGEFDRCLAINLKGVWLCMRAELRLMLPKRSGAIINIASTAGLSGSKRATPYVASKHAVVGITRTAALEYAKHGIRINAVCPGATKTAQARSVFANPQALESMLKKIPAGRYAAPEEIASAVLWLAADEASFATGATLVVDGGMMAG